MPQIKLKHIVSFSSEDPALPADNLLKSETYRKWQCANPGEKQVSVVIELEKALKIHSIDIGNNGSAFVEVLCGRSSDVSNDFQVLLVASSFMSPTESKSGTNSNRVRMFGYDKLSKALADQKWDRIKFICTQPYNKVSAYGLSFVKLHSPPEQTIETTEPKEKVQSRLGAFFLKDEFSSSITTGSLFKKKKENVLSSSTIAAELKEACKRQELPSASKIVNIDMKNKASINESIGERKNPQATTSRSKSKTNDLTTATQDKEPAESAKVIREEKVTHPPTKKLKVFEKDEVSLHEVLKDVIFVLSGFKNPERGHIRDKALAMGARYQGDWNKTCTHLVCAFVNTPKYSQVKATGKGKIISKNWITDCHKRRKRLPEKRYRLRGDSSCESDSSTEDEEYYSEIKRGVGQDKKPTVLCADEPAKNKIKGATSLNDEIHCKTEPANTQTLIDTKHHSDDELSSGHNTEDEIRRVMEVDDDPYGGSTEDETDEEENDKKCENVRKSPSNNLLELPDVFAEMCFLLYGKFEVEERRLLARYIIAYNGKLEEYMSENVKFVITHQDWDDHFNEALVENSCLTFVRPKWIYTCHEKQSFVPFQPFIVGPQ